MATPLSATAQLAAFRRWGITCHEHTIDGTSWKVHNRNSKGPWGPVHGIVWHHTADDAPDDLDFKVCWDGRSDLPGPLCQWGLRDDGSLDMIGNGRCNHAGGGGGTDVLNAVINESYGDYPPSPSYHEGSPIPPAVDGNTVFYGFETYYSGGHKMTADAYATGIALCTAICEAHGWTAKSVIGHKEWSNWKVDPGFLDMAQARLDIDAALKAGPKGGSKPTPPPHGGKFPALADALVGQHKVNVALAEFTKSHPHMPLAKAALTHGQAVRDWLYNLQH